MNTINEGLINVAPSYLAISACLFAAAMLPNIFQSKVFGKRRRIGMTKWDYLFEARDNRIVQRRKELEKQRRELAKKH